MFSSKGVIMPHALKSSRKGLGVLQVHPSSTLFTLPEQVGPSKATNVFGADMLEPLQVWVDTLN